MIPMNGKSDHEITCLGVFPEHACTCSAACVYAEINSRWEWIYEPAPVKLAFVEPNLNLDLDGTPYPYSGRAS